MSGNSSEPRLSVSSEPSAMPSHTLKSGIYDDHEEGSSSQRRSLVGSRHNNAVAYGAPEAQSKNAGTPFVPEAIEAQDLTHRRHRNVRSGGFLLDSTFPSGPRTRQPHIHAPSQNVKEKRSSQHGHGHGHDRNEHHGRIRTGNSTSSSHSPLSQEVEILDQGTTEQRSRIDSSNVSEQKTEHKNGELRVAKSRRSEYGMPVAAYNIDSKQDEVAPQVMIDPNQIVHMALNLSESRRRNLGAGQLVVPQPTGSRRVISSGVQQNGSFRNNGAGSSLRQYLNDQRRASRNISPVPGRGSPSVPRQVSASFPRSMSISHQAPQYAFSDATLARRDKARAYIELRVEYIRLLEFLPPLRPDSSAPGNFTITANNVPGSPHAQLTRIPSYAGTKYELGRAYNPLQYIRNRRSRARERKTLDHAPEEFLDIGHVRDWVDRVEREARHTRYRQLDKVSLPKYHEEHKKEDSLSKTTRARMGWIFTSEELLADAHWLEQDDNKTIIEDRHGRKIFSPKEPQKQDLLLPRGSKEYSERRRRSWVEGLPRLSAELPTGEESEPTSERGRKRRLLPAFRSESPKHKKHGWRSSRPQSGNFSDSSDSGSGSQKHRSRKSRRVIDINNNTGPLELKMREMMEKEAREAKVNPPSVISLDTPDKWGGGYPDISDSSAPRNSVEATGLVNSSAKEEYGHFGHQSPSKNRRIDLGLTLDSSREPRSSFEDLDSTAPNSPLHPKYFPHIGIDLSPPPSRGGSVTKKPKKSRLDIFRSDESTKGSKHELDSAGPDKKQSSRQASEEVAEGNGLGTAILAAPGAVKSLLTHRKNDSVSSLNSPDGWHRKDTKELKEPREPSSAVTRFFKGVKSEGSKVGEFIFRRDRPAEDSDSEMASSNHSPNASDTDEDANKPERRIRPTYARNTSVTTTGSITSKKNGRYHLELPSFRSSSQNDEDKAYATDSQLLDDPITRQTRERANSRSERFDKLAPPRMDLRSISSTSAPALSRPRSPSTGRDRINKVLARPGGVGQGGLPVTSLANPQLSESSSRGRGISRPTLEGKRHWSITDDNGNILHSKATANLVTQSDIARIRALFLCSGVKAREIARRVQMKRPEPPAFLTRAANAANAQLIPIPRKEEHVLAARILVRNLEVSTQALHTSAKEFRESTVKDLTSMISNLKSRVESDLFPRVRSSGDEAVRITSEVSGAAPLAVKQITDEVDKMIRIRRRRMRWVRRVGWMLVEWMLLGVMWWAWLIVVVLSFVRRIFGFGWGVVRWLLWI